MMTCFHFKSTANLHALASHYLFRVFCKKFIPKLSMKKLLATVLFAALSFYSFSQKSPIKFGDIPMEDMKLTSYNLDSSAAAVILTDFGFAYVTENAVTLSLAFERHIRIKILKK